MNSRLSQLYTCFGACYDGEHGRTLFLDGCQCVFDGYVLVLEAAFVLDQQCRSKTTVRLQKCTRLLNKSIVKLIIIIINNKSISKGANRHKLG